MNKASVYYPELDGLRFLAFLTVLIHHSPYAVSVPSWTILNGYGWIGVDLFLCLSAYLFAKLLFVEYQEKGDINIRYFYIRRIFRIWPLYFFFFGIMFAVSILIKGWHTATLVRSLGMLSFTDNLFSMVYGLNGAIIFSAHLWTISYEEQFYLVIPWALRILYRLKNATTTYILGLAMLLGMSIRAVFIGYEVEHPAIWAFPLTHYESIFGGLIIGLGLFDKHLKKISSWILFTAGLTALWLVSFLPNVDAIQWKLMLTYPLVGIGTSLILFATIKGGLGPISILLRTKGLGYLGKISYGLYVYHLIALKLSSGIIDIFVSPDRLLVYPIAVVASTLIMTILISALSYQFLEKPFLRMKDRFTFIHSRPV
jgi:peptidoglycan/LPS O-acetylase OafA/YrhL